MMYEKLVSWLREEHKPHLISDFDKAQIESAADAIEEMQRCIDGIDADNDSLCEQINELQGQLYLMKKTAEWLSEKVPKWIPVTERLPECEWGTEVGNIEWINCGMVFAGCFGRGGSYRDAYFRTWTDGTEGIDAKDADYWRQIQIPEPPKEEA